MIKHYIVLILVQVLEKTMNAAREIVFDAYLGSTWHTERSFRRI